MEIANVIRAQIGCVWCVLDGHTVSTTTLTQLIEQIDSAENLPPRAVAAGLARVVIFVQQLAGEYHFLPLTVF